MPDSPSDPRFRDREAIALDLVGVVGLVALLAGLVALRTSKELGFDAGVALEGILSQLAVTLPAALLVLGASALELGAGLILARAARNRPFDSVAEALIASMVAAVVKDTLLLGTLAAVGAFRQPVLIAIDVVIVAAALGLPPITRRVRPLTAFAGWRDALDSIGSWPVAALVAIVWAGPVVLQLASPVVPFIDVLPNYVGPVEHLRTFGWFSPLTETQSPIIGPSRTVLGYDALLGSIATITNLSGGLAIAGFILPQTILVAAGVHRLANALRRGDAPIGPWALLAFALSQSFARLADARGTVVVVPLVCLGLAIAAEALNDSPDEPAGAAPPAAADPWRIGRGVVIGIALGAATLVHPVIGFFGIVTVVIGALVRPRALATTAFVAGLTAGLIALPQLATMVGASLPTVALGVGLPIALALGIAMGALIAARERVRAGIEHLVEIGRWVAIVLAIAATAGALVLGALHWQALPSALASGVTLILESSGLLLVALVTGIAAGSRGARSPIVIAGLGVGSGALLVIGLLPGNLGFLGDALRFEVPKTVHYWLSTIAAVGAAAALAHLWATGRIPWLARAGAVAAFVAIAAYPLRFGSSGDDASCRTSCEAINAYHLGEHRWSEALAIDLHYAGSGFWIGFPDSRTVVDAPRQQLLDAVRAEIDAGHLVHDTQVVHVASSFQEWVATPLGVFDGVDETFVSLDPEVSHQTVGGRLHGLESLPGFLASGSYSYVVLEPAKLPDGTRDAIVAAGYQSIYANAQGEVFALRH
ncbi:MAG TPA: hypothetical protein VE011_04455 [Candidatus Dormibacteraeota bacterium]|nr:hypothetical protein [Candidatus Dormibacteraeota bacterium]